MQSTSIQLRSFSRYFVCLLFFSFLFTTTPLAQTNDGPSIPVSFRCENHSIKGIFFPAINASGTHTAILLHGFPSVQGDLFGLGEALSKAGIHALTFSYTGIHESEGIHTYAGVFLDIKAAIAFLAESDLSTKYMIDTSRIVLIGHCYGGAMALNYAARHSEIRRVIALEPVQPGEFARMYLQNNELASAMDSVFDGLMRPNGPVNFKGREDLRKTVQNSEPYDLTLIAPKIADREILLITGWDDYVTMTEAHHLPFYRSLKKAGATHVEFVGFHTNHGFRGVREDMARAVIRWIFSK